MDEMQTTTTRRGLVKALVALPTLAAAPLEQPFTSSGVLLPQENFLTAAGLIHLNTASAGPTSKRVLASTVAAWKQLESDPVAQSYYDHPGTVFSLADAVRLKAAELIGGEPNNILLTRGTTDGITTLAHSIRLTAGDRVLLGNLEHEGGEVGWLHRQKLDGIIVDRVKLILEDHDAGRIVAAYERAIQPNTRVISVSHVLAPTGLRMPIAEIAKLARSRGILCVVDGAQAVGHIDVDVQSLGCHAYATSGHKWLMGPKGTGFIHVADDAQDRIDLAQWQLSRKFGSDSAGLGPLTLAVGLGQAIDDIRAIGLERVQGHNRDLANRAYAGLAGMKGVTVVSAPPGPTSTAMVAARLPPSIDARKLRDKMRERHGIVIKQAEKRWFNGIRLSPHVFNDQAQIETAFAALEAELRAWNA